MATQYKGISRQHELAASSRRKDTRTFFRRVKDGLKSAEGVIIGLMVLSITAIILTPIPFSGELLLLFAWFYRRKFVELSHQIFNFPYRVPIQAKLRDGSTPGGKLGGGITFIGQDLETKEQIYAGNSDLRTHMLVLGTTGSGKTEFLLGLVANALVQNTGFIYVDGKGDPKLQNQVFRLSRFMGREDDLLLINFITSGRDFVEKQEDKVTNNMNMMGNISSGMLIELIVALLDDSGGGGDMWKGRAISFIAALTRPLVYMRDKGFINLSPEEYLGYFELNVLEELVWEHNGKYGELFDVIVAPLRSYLLTLPGYQKAKAKKQETKTLEQHGFIVMQLTRTFNDLTFNYGHIFKTKRGDVDFFDVVVNRRLFTALLPALERAPDSMRMLGKLIVGSIKQMMAGCLGNRVEGQVREIIESRPTNAPVPFYCILDEYGYYAVIGFAVAPAQARSLGFSVIFAAQDFSSLKKSSAEEADATWENTNIRAVGRLTSGLKSETWDRIEGAAGQADVVNTTAYERNMDGLGERFFQQDNVSVERRGRIDYDDLALQENGEFTFLIGKKEDAGRSGGVRIIRGMGFYTASPEPREMRINDFLPVEPPEPSELPEAREALSAVISSFQSGNFAKTIDSITNEIPQLNALASLLEKNYENPNKPKLSRNDAIKAILSVFLKDAAMHSSEAIKSSQEASSGGSTAWSVEPEPEPKTEQDQILDTKIKNTLVEIADGINVDRETNTIYNDADNIRLASEDDEIISSDISIDADEVVTTNLMLMNKDHLSFKDRAMSLINEHRLAIDADVFEPDWGDDDIAYENDMIDMEIAARGEGFESFEDRWQAKENIENIQSAIEDKTTYIEEPRPEPVSLDSLSTDLDKLGSLCNDIVKKDLQH